MTHETIQAALEAAVGAYLASGNDPEPLADNLLGFAVALQRIASGNELTAHLLERFAMSLVPSNG
jgi:hypothetical protein